MIPITVAQRSLQNLSINRDATQLYTATTMKAAALALLCMLAVASAQHHTATDQD